MPTGIQSGLAPVRQVLPNGAVILAKESRGTPAVTISAAVSAGTLVDPDDRPGTAHFLSRVIDRGTARRSAEEIGELLDERAPDAWITCTATSTSAPTPPASARAPSP